MKLHLVALPHTRVEPTFCGCAYTAKVLKFCRMMNDRHDITLYAPESTSPPTRVEFVPCLPEAERVRTFGKDSLNRLPEWPTNEQALTFNLNVIRELSQRAVLGDLVLLTGGYTHEMIARALPNLLFIEPFVGYEGSLEKSHCAFESYAHMHTVYAKRGINDIRWFDAVIPPFADPDEFPHLNEGGGEYLLFLGRLIERKGPHIALEIAKRCGVPLYVAGAGGKLDGETIVGDGVRLEGDVKLIGPVNVEERAKLLAGAKALVCPTTYCEPGGNVAIEAMMAGTPVITADFGVFSETVSHGLSGFHFRHPREAAEAVNYGVKTLDPETIRAWAADRYSLTAVGQKFDCWFNRLVTLFCKGWDEA
jgi:glycosyltransferase involved in cell wall biosynthesis